MAHTPGPWVITTDYDGGRVYQIWHDGPNARLSPRICSLRNASTPVLQLDIEEMHSNARLIEAAPDMLQALKSVLDLAVQHADKDLLDKLRQTIVKAEGKEAKS